ncbi:MAG: 16S rRNA (adenine(1518)-N(6)/adenine(1519)-N(6))-dimethyltransferase [Bacteroidetes bacterium GWF2_33_16]|nr:MAG: 16S rRNA (adenine(1518)-N(6)/adenine(1519)-N(6))-dimethyltransferase [Bacteroidetes bacterium GWE2_32_14]OFY05253.1 MAG: 16S rRNA (adenine(1518)-N(6)/adenine(1519)-N(6))-dimethyltransferase [Bacteroidetes bacterium GWF2_33_16]
MSYVRPKKSLGQHFLKDQNIARKIVAALDQCKQKTILEIGPGTGVLTSILLSQQEINLYAIEVDTEAYEYLKIEYPQLREKLILADFLKINIRDYFQDPITMIGNFPYNISSQIFFKVLENRDLVLDVVCMIQKEVADRIKASHGNKTYGILSVFLQAFYDIEYLFTVGPNVFDPPPKVNSAVIHLKRNNRKALDCNEELFFKVVKLGFNQRRKTLRNSLKSILVNLPTDNPIFNKRPEQLSVDELIYLTNIIDHKN